MAKTYSREEIERIISICENIEKRGVDPFTVDVKDLLQRLRRMLEENPDLDHYTLDSEILYKIAVVIALQNRWLGERARALFIDSQLISSRLASMDKKAIVQAFLRVWFPIVSLSQITAQRLRHGLDHFLSLPTRRDERTYGWKLTDREVEILRASIEREKEEMESKMRSLHQELLEEAGDSGEVDYWRFVLKGRGGEAYERAYVLSFLISEGYVEVARDPLKGEIRLKPNRDKVSRRSTTSLVISLRVGR